MLTVGVSFYPDMTTFFILPFDWCMLMAMCTIEVRSSPFIDPYSSPNMLVIYFIAR